MVIIRVKLFAPSKILSLESGEVSHIFLYKYTVLNSSLVKHSFFFLTIINTALCDTESILKIYVVFQRTTLYGTLVENPSRENTHDTFTSFVPLLLQKSLCFDVLQKIDHPCSHDKVVFTLSLCLSRMTMPAS